MRTAKTSPKGQITIPVAMLRALGLQGGAELLLIQREDHILLVDARRAGAAVVDDLEGFESLAHFKDMWDNDIDEVWNDT